MASLMSTRSYFLFSALISTAVVWHAFATREQFFPSMVYLSSSKISLAVLGNMGFALALATYKLLLRVFLGRLRDSELERVNDKVGQAVVETCLAMTIFREDFTATFLTMFVILSFVKIFHWLVQDRVDFIETTPNVSRLQHFRIAAFTLVLLAIDIAFLKFSLHETLNSRSAHGGVSVFLLFAFEYTVQASTIILTFVKYCLSMADMAMEGRWEGKGVAVFYLELTLDMLHLLVYCAFFAVVFSTYGIPLHLVRDLYWTFRNFQTRVRDFLRYRRITANMDQSFPDATEEDLQRADHTCIICREEMSTAGRNKKLGCSHVFHLHCLRSWLERQQNCPICRRSVMPPARGAAGAAPGAAGAAGGGGAPDELAAAAERMRAAAAQDLAGAAAAAGQAPAQAGAGMAFGAAAAAGQGAHPQMRRRRGWRVLGGAFGGDGGGAQAAAGAGLAGLEGWPVMAQFPQWVPAAPMAVFVPAGGLPQIQYAGQQHAEQVMAAQHQAAAAAAAAAAALPLMGMMGMHPMVLPQFMAGHAMPAVAAAPPTPQQHVAAAAAAAAAAASLLGPFAGGAGAAATAAGAAAAPAAAPAGGLPAMDAAQAAAAVAAAEAMERVLQQQLESLRAHQERARQAQQAAAAAGPAAPVPSAGSAAAAQHGGGSAGNNSSGADASAPADPAQPSTDSAQTPPPAAPAAAAPTPTVAPPAPAEVNGSGSGTPAVPPPAAPSASQASPADDAQPAPAGEPARPARREEEEDSEAGALRRRRLERFGGGA